MGVNEEHGQPLRNRAPSENQALERNQLKLGSSDKDKFMSPHTILTNGTDSIVGSLQTQSLQGDKSRLSAPVTIPAKVKPSSQPKESAYTAEVVNEVDDEDSKILSVENSNSKVAEDVDNLDRLAYKSAYPHSTKNVRGGSKKRGVASKTKVSI